MAFPVATLSVVGLVGILIGFTVAIPKVAFPGEVRRLAEEMFWIFKAQGVHREALAALALFQEAARRESATVELIRRVMRKIEEARAGGG